MQVFVKETVSSLISSH